MVPSMKTERSKKKPYPLWKRPISAIEKTTVRLGLGPLRTLTLPDFQGIGAQKGGTTWLYENLRCHPQLFLPKHKELHYFDNGFHKSLRSYSRHFAPGSGKVRGEITPAYGIIPPSRIRFIRALLPEVKLILLMRNPVDRAWSHAMMNLVSRAERRLEDVTDAEFKSYLKTDDCRKRSDYGMLLDNWMSVFPRERFFLGFYEDLAEHPEDLLSGVFDHLGVRKDVDWSTFPLRKVVLPRYVRSADQHRNSSSRMRPEIATFLREMYAGEIDKLHERFGERVARWRFE